MEILQLKITITKNTITETLTEWAQQQSKDDGGKSQ